MSRTLPRSRWSCFFLKPETLLRWHRRLVAGGREEDRGGAQVAARESLEELSRELQVEAHRLAAWRDDFLAAGK